MARRMALLWHVYSRLLAVWHEALAYTHHPTQGTIDVSRFVAILVILMQLVLTIRLYAPRLKTAQKPALEPCGALRQAKNGMKWRS